MAETKNRPAGPMLTPNTSRNAFTQLYADRLLTAKRPFLARGITVKRCPTCALAAQYCMCAWLKPFAPSLPFDVVLLMHRDEILKPTNTGRLLAEAFPKHCLAFEWSRLEPPKALKALIHCPTRQCAIVYPARDNREPVVFDALNKEQALPASRAVTGVHTPPKRPTLIFLDGTWRQAARMFNHSAWLKHLPFYALNDAVIGEYAVRKASDESRLATAEAASLVLSALNATQASAHLHHIFTVFNRHYAATRSCVPVKPCASHAYLTQYELQ